ncbi:hypothetical protein JHK87_011666 [Glycine soja]|nr:hypothetical protein JHK87_011666 [Glycine soja]
MDCNVSLTPAEVNLKLDKCENEATVDGTIFRQIVGSLRYICHTRPELAFSVGMISKFMSDPRHSHMVAAKRILRYLRALSTCEAEYIAACLVACQASWLFSLLQELGVIIGMAIELLVDIKSAIDLARNPVSHDRSKHIETKFHFLRDQVAKGKVKLVHCRTEVQLAEIMTKALKANRFKELRRKIGIQSLED